MRLCIGDFHFAGSKKLQVHSQAICSIANIYTDLFHRRWWGLSHLNGSEVLNAKVDAVKLSQS